MMNKIPNMKNLPNQLTTLRLISSIPLIIFLERNNILYVWIIILIGGITDYLDGYYARKFRLNTKMGAILDPLADKVFIFIPFIWLCKYKVIPFWSVSILLIREFMVSSFRVTKDNGLPAIKIAKYKTLLQFISLVILLSNFKEIGIQSIGLIIYWISFVLSIVSSYFYLKIK